LTVPPSVSAAAFAKLSFAGGAAGAGAAKTSAASADAAQTTRLLPPNRKPPFTTATPAFSHL
jgi:hypothetical protein